MKIKLPSLSDQKKIVFEASTKEAIRTLKNNLKVGIYPSLDDIDESKYSNAHYLIDSEDWEPPHPDIIRSYFSQLQHFFPDEIGSDKKIAELLGLTSDRRVREYKSGDRKMPKTVWRHFLILTGRAPQDVIEVLGYFE